MNYFKYKDIDCIYHKDIEIKEYEVIKLKEDYTEFYNLIDNIPFEISKDLFIPTGVIKVYERVTDNLYKERTYYSCLLIIPQDFDFFLPFIYISLILINKETHNFPSWEGLNINLQDKYPCNKTYFDKKIIRKSDSCYLFKLVNPEELNPDDYLYVLIDELL
jgi:hypothetical protein